MTCFSISFLTFICFPWEDNFWNLVWTVISANLNFQQFHLEEKKELRWQKFFIAMTRNKVFFSLSIEIFHDTTNGLKKAPDTTNRTSRGRYRNWFNKFSFGCMWLCKCKTSINLTPTTRLWNTLLNFILSHPRIHANATVPVQCLHLHTYIHWIERKGWIHVHTDNNTIALSRNLTIHIPYIWQGFFLRMNVWETEQIHVAKDTV